MCDVQRCFSGECEGSWDCTEEAVVQIAFMCSGGFYGRMRRRVQRRCIRCFLKWCDNRRRKNYPLSDVVVMEEKRWRAYQIGRDG